MAGGDAQHLSAGDDAGAADCPPLDPAGEVKARFAHIPDAGEPGVEEQPHLVDCADQLVAEQLAVCEGAGVLIAGQVGVDVDKPGQDGPAGEAVGRELLLRAVFIRAGVGNTRSSVIRTAASSTGVSETASIIRPRNKILFILHPSFCFRFGSGRLPARFCIQYSKEKAQSQRFVEIGDCSDFGVYRVKKPNPVRIYPAILPKFSAISRNGRKRLDSLLQNVYHKSIIRRFTGVNR